MDKPAAIARIARRFRNEDAHSDRVCLLALRLFDALPCPPARRAADRRLLATAAWLHDIAYGAGRDGHAARAATWLRQHDLPGLTRHDGAGVAAIVALHSRDLPVPLPRSARVRRLGAILRVADGLDHEHTQSTRIVALRGDAAGVTITLAGPRACDDLAAARRKGDLWRATLPQPLRLRLARATATKPPPPCAATPSVRQVLAAQFTALADTVTLSRRTLLEGYDVEALHQLRVALRRAAALCRLWHAALHAGPAASLRRRLRDLGRRLGDARDADVWALWLADVARETGPAAAAARATLRLQAAAPTSRLRQAARQVLLSAAVTRTVALLTALPPRLATLTDDDLDAPFAAAARRHLVRRWQKLRRASLPEATRRPRAFHRYRRRVRRLRDLAELARPWLGAEVDALAAALASLTHPLGVAHDGQAALARPERGEWPAALQARLARQLRQAVRQAVRARKQFASLRWEPQR